MKTNYYKGKHMEAWSVIEIFTDHLKGINAFNAGNVIKYLLRYDTKGQALSDLNKAKHYMDNIYMDEGEPSYKIPYYLDMIIYDFKRNKEEEEYKYFYNCITMFVYAINTNNYDTLEDAKYCLQELINQKGLTL